MEPTEPPSPARRSWPRRLLNRLEVDRAVFYAVAARGWQLVAGPVSILLIAVYFTPEIQGYYYTFASLLALQAFVELGFHVVILNVASHEWSRLGLDERGAIAGDPDARSRLVSLGRLSLRWYTIAALVFVLGAVPLGLVFFAGGEASSASVEWRAPWITSVVLMGLVLTALPLTALLEGCHQVVAVHRFRLVETVASSLVVWVCIPLGAELWTVPATAAARLTCAVWLVGVRYRRFFAPLLRPPSGPRLEWRSEVWPMQWRVALQGVFGYLAWGLFIPVMFHYHGAATAGRMGMTWTALTALQTAALAWVATRAPRLGTLVARRDWRELDRVFFRVGGVSLWLLAAADALLWGLIWLLHHIDHWLADRVLPPLPTALFMAGLFLTQVTLYQSIYVRAHKRDPYLAASLVSSLLIGLLVWQLGARYGPPGAAAGNLLVLAVFTVPCWTAVWWKARREWHAEAPSRL